MTAYHDDDDDEEEFKRADAEEDIDAEYGASSKFLVGNKENKYKKKGNYKRKDNRRSNNNYRNDNSYLPPIPGVSDNVSNYGRDRGDTDRSAILRKETMTSEFFVGQLYL